MSSIIPKVVPGGAGLLSILGVGGIDPNTLRHQAPQPPRTEYLPVSGVGGIDGDQGDADSVDAFDAKVEAINAATVNYQPANVSSFCAGDGCEAGGDCDGTPSGVPEFHGEDALAPIGRAFADLQDVMKGAVNALASCAGEPSADRLAAVYSGGGTGTFNINDANGATEAVLVSIAQASEVSHEAATTALGTLRQAVISLRNVQATRAEHHVSALDWALGAPLALNPLGAAVAVASTAWNAYDVLQGSGATDAGIEAVDNAATTLEAVQASNDAAVANLRAALSDWTITPNGAVALKVSRVDAPAPAEAVKVGDTTPIGEPPTSTEPTLAAPLTSDEPSLEDKLNDLLGSPIPSAQDAIGGLPSAGMPVGGGMPSMGSGMPSDMGSGMSSPLSDALGDEELAEPLDDLSENEGDDELAEPLDDVTEEAEAEEPLTDPTDEEGLDTDAVEPETETDDTEALPEDTGEVAPVAAVETNPNSAEARTADVGNGRQVEFPSAKLASLADTLARGAEQGLGFTLKQEASELGFQIPPDGQDIGKQVPTSLMQPGDVLVSSAGTGIFIGDGDVMMEDGKIVPVDEAAVFDGQNQGIFRLDEGTDTTSATAGGQEPSTVATGVAQPVGDGDVSPLSAPADATAVVSTPGEATAQEGTPGVPTDDAEAVSETDATATPFGTTDNGADALNPDAIFPNG
ncbi:Uncharacterised protein [Mycobacteroides abscessus subsp. abscessus]|uniref:hypothetical protein n=1 Tax=Mycobacteroides abscessus TaxID=36809 RepID=UPI000925E00B|nr:hypothetical protein [Mycobacteroides abscessus]SIC63157.1 Uncharacterised protein [Mycobacteroides abscessus subsp. abscessus]SIG63988.1 Uncharacterised protein [Mycobacteroides abscessus subsp. abscessus]